jgi:hypothetical protein
MVVVNSMYIHSHILFIFFDSPPDDDTAITTSKMSDSELAYLHGAFEKAFCAKIQRSGSANFANVSDCSFRFVYNPLSSVAVASA